MFLEGVLLKDPNELGFTPEQRAAWKAGELCIEFSFDEPPQVNQQDFEQWVQERGIKPNLVQTGEWVPYEDYQVVYSEEIKPLLPGRCIK